MAKSKRLNQLLSRISFLETKILPPEKIDGNYTKIESDLIKSYLLLVHAEIEAYFEDKAKEKAQKALADWRLNRKKSNCLTAIMAFAGNELSYKNEARPNYYNIEFRVNRAVSHYLDSLNKNNGVKQSDLINIMIPIGIEISEVDNTWLNVMDSFGAARGLIAHKSLRVQNQLDRNTEKDRINNQIIPEIVRLDQLIQRKG